MGPDTVPGADVSAGLALVGYLRVSSNQQADSGTIEMQRDEIASWARANGHRITRWAEDEAVSGAKELSARPGLVSAVDAMEEGVAEGVVVWKLDRLARDFVVQEASLAHLRQHGAVLSVHDQMLLDDEGDGPEFLYRRTMRLVMGAFAELDRAMTRWRMEQGRLRKAQRGGYTGGRPRLGLRAVDGELVDDPAEQAAIERVIALRVAGNSYRRIVEVVSAEGHVPKGGRRWHAEIVRRICLRRDVA